MGMGGFQDLTWTDLWTTQQHAFPLDLSMTGYILALPAVSFVILLFLQSEKDLNRKWIRIFFLIAVFLCTLIFMADLSLYPEWSSKINRKAMASLAYPDKVLISALSAPLVWMGSLLSIYLLVNYVLFCFFFRAEIRIKATLPKKVIASSVLILLTVIGMRGGFQPMPLKKSSVYFSRNNVLNLAALNSTYNFMDLLIHSEDPVENPYAFYSNEEARYIFKQMHMHVSDSTVMISKLAKPNIIMILLESWSGDVIGPLRGEGDVSPQFTRLCTEGLFFDRFYSNGFRTEQGQVALLSGFPAQPSTSIMNTFEKYDKLPGLSAALKVDGYYSAYYYSGDLAYANMGSYLQSTGFDLILGESKVAFKHRTHWGAYDEELFDYNLAHMESIPRPFFSLLMTATSHEPFDADVHEGFEGEEEPDRYRNTVHYTDRVMGDYMEEAQTKSWYDSSLIFIVSAHAHRFPYDRTIDEVERYHIPFLITGGALKDEFRGKINHRVASQVDFPAIVLGQLGLNAAPFNYSKNVFDPAAPSFAFYAFENGFGIVDDQQTLIYNTDLKELIAVFNSGLPPQAIDIALIKGKAYLQKLMQDYVEY